MTTKDAPTDPIKRPVKLSEDTHAYVRLGTLVAILAACCTASVWLWQIKDNGDRTASAVRDLQASLVPYTQKVDRLWWEHNATAKAKIRDEVP